VADKCRFNRFQLPAPLCGSRIDHGLCPENPFSELPSCHGPSFGNEVIDAQRPTINDAATPTQVYADLMQEFVVRGFSVHGRPSSVSACSFRQVAKVRKGVASGRQAASVKPMLTPAVRGGLRFSIRCFKPD
jgi:hypothetical protein